MRSHKEHPHPYLLANYTASYDMNTVLVNNTAEDIAEFIKTVYLDDLYEGTLAGGEIDSSYVDYIADDEATDQGITMADTEKIEQGVGSIK